MKIFDLLNEQPTQPAGVGMAAQAPAAGTTPQTGMAAAQPTAPAQDPALQKASIAQHQQDVMAQKKDIQDQIADLTQQIADLRKKLAEIK